MSYILEALKKAQAERQLGNAPTLHAPQVQTAQPGAAASRKPLVIGLGAGAVVVALGALLVWQRTPAPAATAPADGAAALAVAGPAAVPTVSAAAPAAPAAGPALAANPPAANARPAAASASNTLEVSAPPAPEPAPSPVRSAHVAAAPAPQAIAGSAGKGTPASTTPARSPAMAEAAAPTPRAAPSPAPAPAAAAAPEDSLPYLRQLPDTIQRDIPRVTFGGYMYSANPADRLLLVDKTLRHEGEEVGPGLVLEKLLPKAAVMNFRGIRYRVAY
jgi:general secretion pathway protein B